MSRIEQALEKALKMRKTEPPGTTPEKAYPEPSYARTLVYPEAAIPINITNPYLVSATDPNSYISEEYSKLKSLILRMTKHGGRQNLIMVTSSVAGEGKSITALNLAISMAQEHDHTVMLIDADLRRPSVHRYLGIEQKTGLADCLISGTDLGQVIVNTGVGRLAVVPAGCEVRKPVELFSSEKMAAFCEEIKNRYPDRYIIFDTPPILPFAETRLLSHLVDGIIFVVKRGLAPLKSVTEALEVLKERNVLGLVFNDADETNSLASHYYGYYGTAKR